MKCPLQTCFSVGLRFFIVLVQRRSFTVSGLSFDLGLLLWPAPVVTTTPITHSSKKSRMGNILVPDNSGPPGKWPLKRRENVREGERNR